MIVFLDLETTGLDPISDRILEVAALAVEPAPPPEYLRPLRGVCSVIKPSPGIQLNMDSYVQNMHTRNGLLAAVEAEGVPLGEAQKELCAFLASEKGPHTLAGNSVHFDLGFLRSWMPVAAEHFSHRLLDVSAISLARHAVGLSDCPIHAGDAHRAQGDVLTSIAKARWFMSRMVP